MIDKVLTMVVAEFLSPNHTMQVGLHQFLYEVNLLEIVKTWRLQDIDDCNDIFVMKVTKKFNLAKSSKTKHRVIKG